MKTLPLLAFALMLSAAPAVAQSGISISFDSDDDRTEIGDRRDLRDAKVAITSSDGSTVLMLIDDVVAMQLSDKALARMEQEKKAKKAGFLEELLVSGVKLAIGKSVEYPAAHIRTAELRNGVLHLTTDKNEPIFDNVKVNGADVMKSFSKADATRFVNALRAKKK